MQQKQPSTNFEHRLFIALAQIFPDMSVRDISKWAGKSSGYWSSVLSQGRQVSTSAIKNLNDYIECRKILLHHEDALHIRLSKVQDLIRQEIVGRLMTQIQTIDYAWEDVFKTITEEEQMEDANYGALPFLLSSYR
jgi:hypothetical protein